MQSIIIEANPQTKERARFRNGRAYTPIKTRAYQERVARIWREKYPEPNAGAVAIYVQFYLRIPSSWTKAKKDRAERGEILPTVRPDVDNLAKCIFDGLNGVAYQDDKQIVQMIVSKRYSKNPRTRVCVSEVV